MSTQKIVTQVKGWIYQAADYIKTNLNQPLKVDYKTSQADIVTNIDQEVEAFLVEKITTHYPNDRIIGEESGISQQPVADGATWVIDPIDGTLNFYKQRDHFCIMVAYQNKEVSLGFIYEVMRDEFLYGGKNGVYLNERRLTPPKSVPLAQSILSINSKMILKNQYHLSEIAQDALALRMVGCAGIGMKEVILGKQQAYISYLQPWDFAAGKIMAEALGIEVKSLTSDRLSLERGEAIIVASPELQAEMKNMMKL